MIAYCNAMVCWIEGSNRRIEHVENNMLRILWGNTGKGFCSTKVGKVMKIQKLETFYRMPFLPRNSHGWRRKSIVLRFSLTIRHKGWICLVHPCPLTDVLLDRGHPSQLEVFLHKVIRLYSMLSACALQEKHKKTQIENKYLHGAWLGWKRILGSMFNNVRCKLIWRCLTA